MTKKAFIIKRNRGKRSMKISHEEVDKAVDEYLRGGGKITVLDPESRDFKELISIKDSSGIADDFLLSR